MRYPSPKLLLILAVTPSSALAQSQPGGTQQLLSELRAGKETAPAPEIHLDSTGWQPMEEAPDVGEVQIGSIIVADPEGQVHPEFGPVIERYVGSAYGQKGLQDLATAIAEYARSQGYIFASAYVPQQRISLGSLRVIVDLGRIDDVEISGSNNARLAKMLGTLKGEFAHREPIERKLLLARDIPGITVDSTDYVRENGRGKLIVRTTEARSNGYASIDNYGDSETGPYRARLEVDYTGIFEGDDRISASASATPLQPDELTFISARYANLLGTDGSQIWLTGAAGRTHEQGPFDDWRSRSRYIALAFNTPLQRSNRTSLWLTAEAAFLDVDQSSGTGDPLNDHVSTISLTLSGNTKVAGGRLSGGLSMVQGLDILGATKANDPSSSRLDGSAVFTKEQLWLNWYGLLGSGFSLRVAGNGQIASRPLLASQEIGLGGIGYGRAYSFYERSGDEGAMGLVEMRHATEKPAKFIDWLQFYGFFDGGYVSNLGGGGGSGSLMSSGAGIRSGFGKAELGLEIAVPVNDVRAETQNKNPRVNFSVGYRF